MRGLIVPSLAAATVIYVGMVIVPPLEVSCADPGEAAAGAARAAAELMAHPLRAAFYVVLAYALIGIFWGGQILVMASLANAVRAPLIIGAVAGATLILVENHAFVVRGLYAHDGCSNPVRETGPWAVLAVPVFAVTAVIAGVAFEIVRSKTKPKTTYRYK